MISRKSLKAAATIVNKMENKHGNNPGYYQTKQIRPTLSINSMVCFFCSNVFYAAHCKVHSEAYISQNGGE